MGGGVGVSQHGSHRVATDRTTFAMPETGIGLFPKYGRLLATVLPRLPGSIRHLLLGLTGRRLKVGLRRHRPGAHAFVVSHDKPVRLVMALAENSRARWTTSVCVIEESFAEPVKDTPITAERDAIDRYFGKGTVEEIIASLTADGGDWAKHQLRKPGNRNRRCPRRRPASDRLGGELVHWWPTCGWHGAWPINYRHRSRLLRRRARPAGEPEITSLKLAARNHRSGDGRRVAAYLRAAAQGSELGIYRHHLEVVNMATLAFIGLSSALGDYGPQNSEDKGGAHRSRAVRPCAAAVVGCDRTFRRIRPRLRPPPPPRMQMPSSLCCPRVRTCARSISRTAYWTR